MATGQMNGVLGQLRKVALHDGGGPSDGQLLECFLAQRDEAAFGALVRRHGPMVLGVCQRVLRVEARPKRLQIRQKLLQTSTSGIEPTGL